MAGLQLKGLVHCHHGEKHGRKHNGAQGDMMLDQQAAERESDTGPGLSI